jgi:predicted ATPase
MISDSDIQNILGNDPDNDDSLPLLVDRCKNPDRIVVPFVGAGLSKPFGFPLWGEFLKACVGNRPELREKINTRIAANEYEEAASDLADALPAGVLQSKMEKAFGDSNLAGKNLNGAVEQLTRFPSARLVTTNFDRVLETSFRENGIQLRSSCGGEPQYGVEALNQGKPFLLKLHGDWEDPDHRVLTLPEYEKAYGHCNPEAIDTSRPLPELLGLLLKSRCILFIGCSLAQDRTMRTLRQISKQYSNHIQHFAIVEKPDGETPEQSAASLQTRRNELSQLSITPIWYPKGQHGAVEAVLTYLAEQMESVFSRPRRDKIPGLGNLTVGREAEIADIASRLTNPSGSDRLITILGAGGCGKTRIAIEVANRVKSSFSSGVGFVPLSDLQLQHDDTTLLPSRIGKELGVPELPKHPPHESLIAYFRSGKHLLILDTCEHLAEAASELAASLLDECGSLKILATSRKVLGSTYESVYPVNPLAVPGSADEDVSAIANTGAVQLFVQRARQRRQDFVLDVSNAKEVANICTALAGIPLAIEIAAARVNVRTPAEISEETSRLLNEGFRDAHLSHWKTMSGAIDWSYKLLPPRSQKFARDMSVFVGGWTLEAAAAVCNAALGSNEVEELTSELVDSSLFVHGQACGRSRFRFLDPIRQFMQQQRTPEEIQNQQERHGKWFLGVAENAAPKFLTGEQNVTLDALQPELDNFRQAIGWARETKQADIGLRLMVGLWRFMEIRAYYTEGLDLANKVLAIPGTESEPGLKCRLLSGAGMLKYRTGDFAVAEAFFQQCFDIAEARQDSVEMADALSGLGLVAMMKGDFKTAQDRQERCRQLEVANKNERNAAVATYNLGFIALGMGDNDTAIARLGEALNQFQAAHNNRESAFALDSQARAYIVSGQLDAAKRNAGIALEIRRKLADNKCAADSLRTLGWAAIEGDDLKAGAVHLEEAIRLARGVDDARGVSEALELAALISAKQGNDAKTVRLVSAAAKIRGAYGYALPPALVAQRQAALEHAKTTIGQEAYEAEWNRAAALPLPDIISEALPAFAG